MNKNSVLNFLTAKTFFTLLILFFNSAGDGLPGEYSVTNRWRMIHNPVSPTWNPAIITEAGYITSRLAFNSTLNEFYMHETGVTVPIGLYQSAGITWQMQGTDDFEATRWNNSDDIISTGRNISDNSSLFAFTYAINPWRRLSAGANINLIYHNLFDEEQQVSAGIDLGITYRMLRHQLFGDHLFGVSLQNIIQPEINSSEKYSSTLRFLLDSRYLENRLESSIDFTMKDLITEEDLFSFDRDSIMEKVMEWDVNCRLGTWLMRIFKLHGLFGFHADGLDYWGFAGGINAPTVNDGRVLSINYQYITTDREKSGSHTWYIEAEIGKHREEIFARKMARMVDIAPNELYNRALTLYYKGAYWDAYFVFAEISSQFPDFFKNDWVEYYKSSCLEELDMRNAALKKYSGQISDFPRSASVPFSLLGKMRILYRNNMHGRLTQEFDNLNKPGTPDSLKFHAVYIMAQSNMKQNKFKNAAALFDMILRGHPDFIYARHSSAIANIRLGDVNSAISDLEICFNTTTDSKADKEIVNRSFVILGLLLYENYEDFEGGLAKAVTALRNVPETSYYYETAQLGLAWIALKAGQWEDCIQAAQNLKRVSQKIVLNAEADLLHAYTFMIQKNFSAALSRLKPALSSLEQYSGVYKDSLEKAQNTYDSVRTEYASTAKGMIELGKRAGSSDAASGITSLRPLQKNLKNSIDSYYKFMDNVKRIKLFDRNLDDVKSDIQYAIAKCEKVLQNSETGKIKKDAVEEIDEIDEEIQKLQEQLEK